MSQSKNRRKKCGLFVSPVEQFYLQAKTPIEEFVHDEASSGLLLMGCAIAALVIANTGFYNLYDSILHTKITIDLSFFSLSYSLHHWINDGLMGLFFLTIGLEIKREILIGELASLKNAILPVSAAIGGMVVPALLYTAVNFGTDAMAGWAVPMATDIAFALGVLALLGPRIPKKLIAFLLALAIVDDLGAVLIIAIFFTEQIHMVPLLFSGACFLLLIMVNAAGIRRPLPYMVIGTLLWLGLLKSGVHATLAGVLTALTIPANSVCLPDIFAERIIKLMGQFKESIQAKQTIMENSEQQGILQTVANYVHSMESPLQYLEHKLHIWVSFVIVPVFALANAGIPIDFSTLGNTLIHPVTIGVTLGLICGKAIGIFLFSYVVVKTGLSKLPDGVTLSMISGVAILAGIGFTMSIFIADLAFAGQNTNLLNAKIGIVVASLAAGLAGYIWLLLATKPPENTTESL